MKIVGVTGNIGCGKSTVCKLFEYNYNVPIFYSDLVAKELIRTNREIQYQIAWLFGIEVFNSDGTVKRKFIFDKIFNNRELLDDYNAIIHPPVIAAFDAWVIERAKENHPYIIEESALIFECNLQNKFDFISAVTCDENIRFSRAAERSGLTVLEVKAIDSIQIPEAKKASWSDRIIYNSADIEYLSEQVDKIHTFLTGSSSTIRDNNIKIAEFMGYTYYGSNHPEHPKHSNPEYYEKYDDWCGWKTHKDLKSISKFNMFNPELTGHKFLGRSHNDLKYNTDWNMLMEVVDKIKNTIIGTTIMINESRDEKECIITNLLTNKTIRVFNEETIIKTVHQAVVDFIIWWNNSK